MLQIAIIVPELWDEKNQEFIEEKKLNLQLEHSLVSLGKWESKWKKPFLSKQEKTIEESIDYIRCMTLNKNVSPDLYHYISNENIDQVSKYIEDPMTATTITRRNLKTGNKEIVTAEIIYYWMISYQIPFECRKWHLNRLLTLIEVFDVKNSPPQKMSRREIMRRNAAINAERRKKWNTKG